MNIMHKAGLVLAGALLAAPLWAQQRAETYLERINGQRMVAQQITADPQGNLNVQMDSGVTIRVPRAEVKLVVTPKPREVTAMEQGLAANQADDVIRAAPAALNRYQFLGWNGPISYLEGMAQMAKGDLAAAERAFERGLRQPDQSELDLACGRAQLLVRQKKGDEALKLLDRIVAAAPPDKAVVAFNTRARVFAEMGRDHEAVLEYLKTILLFKPNQFPEQRAEAKREAAALLKKRNDPRAADIERME
ncbi:MAG: tetratricopeptide repeat protein [Lentisphaeria bacterium]|jgi:tetratricopeptide (TPR) repeat protein